MNTQPKKLYFLSGTMCDHRLWLAVWQHIKAKSPQRFHFIHVDIPQADNIDGILAKLDDNFEDGSEVIGFSLGGYLATAFSLGYPEKVSRLMVVSNMPRELPQAEIKERERTINFLKTQGYSGIPLKRIQGLMHKNAWSNQQAIDTIKSMDADLGVETLLYQLKVTTKRESLLPRLNALTLPIHFCIGQQDHLVDLPYLRQGIENSNNISLSIHNEVGHMLPLEAPELLAEEIIQYFK